MYYFKEEKKKEGGGIWQAMDCKKYIIFKHSMLTFYTT